MIAALALANGAARLTSRFLIIGSAQRVEAELRHDLYAALQRCPPQYFGERSTGDLMSRASSDVSAVRSVVGFGGVSMISTAVAFVGAILAMLAVDPWLTAVAMAPFPVMILLARRFNTSIHERTDAVQDQLGVLSARVQEYVAGMSVVRAYTMERPALARFAEANAEYRERSLRLARAQAQFGPLISLIGGLGMVIVLVAGGRGILDGRLTLGALVAFNGYLAYLAWPTLALGWTLSIVRRGLTSMARIQEVMETAPPELAGAADAPVAARSGAPPALGFRDVTFAYPGRAPVLTGVTFDVKPGEMVAIVGSTGSGKSTLGLLLARLWEPPAGTVTIDVVDVTTRPAGALRATIGYVPQEAFLFSRSLLDNVTLERETITPAGARAAADAAGIGGEIERFPRGFATVVGERGLTLSGGQRARVALARALAGDPPILVLDDVFANVDFAKEEEILANLPAAAVGRTVLLMTHRLRAARAADRIVVLDRGRVVEEGAHEELVASGGLYARLWRIQQLDEEIARAS